MREFRSVVAPCMPPSLDDQTHEYVSATDEQHEATVVRQAGTQPTKGIDEALPRYVLELDADTTSS